MKRLTWNLPPASLFSPLELLYLQTLEVSVKKTQTTPSYGYKGGGGKQLVWRQVLPQMSL